MFIRHLGKSGLKFGCDRSQYNLRRYATRRRKCFLRRVAYQTGGWSHDVRYYGSSPDAPLVPLEPAGAFSTQAMYSLSTVPSDRF